MGKALYGLVFSVLLFVLYGGAARAAMMENESSHTFRGGEAAVLSARPVKVYAAQVSGLPASLLQGSPLLRAVTSASDADMRLTSGQDGRVRLETTSGAIAGKKEFLLPGEQSALRATLEGLARFRAAALAKGAMPRPDLDWTIRLYSPTAMGDGSVIRHDQKIWNPIQELTPSKDGDVQRILGPVLLTFSFVNRSRAPLYVHLLNYTEEGQVLPVLPPLERAAMIHRVEPGESLTPPDLFLELTSPVEYVRLLVAIKPLYCGALAQENFSSGPLAPGDGKGAAAAEADWYGIAVKFVRQ